MFPNQDATCGHLTRLSSNRQLITLSLNRNLSTNLAQLQ